MALSNFAVVHRRTDASPTFGDPLVHCKAGKQLVLTYIAREALNDYFQVPGGTVITLGEWNLLVDQNLEALKPIIEAKYERDDWEVHDAYGQTYPRLVVTLQDIQRGEALSADILQPMGATPPSDDDFDKVVAVLEALHPDNAMCEQALAESWEPHISIAKWVLKAEARLAELAG